MLIKMTKPKKIIKATTMKKIKNLLGEIKSTTPGQTDRVVGELREIKFLLAYLIVKEDA